MTTKRQLQEFKKSLVDTETNMETLAEFFGDLNPYSFAADNTAKKDWIKCSLLCYFFEGGADEFREFLDIMKTITHGFIQDYDQVKTFNETQISDYVKNILENWKTTH